MLIEEAFKRFTNGVLSETKIKKEYDLCIDVYSKTQLIDLSALQNSPDILQYMKAINADQINKISTHSAILHINKRFSERRRQQIAADFPKKLSGALQ